MRYEDAEAGRDAKGRDKERKEMREGRGNAQKGKGRNLLDRKGRERNGSWIKERNEGK